MAAHKSTILNAPGQSTDYQPINWSSFDSGANNVYFDVSNVAADRMLILVAGHSTLACHVWIGTSDSRSSQTANYPYSANKLGRMEINTTVVGNGNVRSKFRSTVDADTEVFAIYALGPFETARFKDSDGYINVCRGVQTAGEASHSSDAQYIAAIYI